MAVIIAIVAGLIRPNTIPIEQVKPSLKRIAKSQKAHVKIKTSA